MSRDSSSGGSRGGGKGGGGDAIIQVGQHEMPKGLLDFISELEYIHTQELRGIADTLDENFYTTKDRLVAMEVGFRQTFLSGLVTALMSPIAIGVLEKMIPVFGSPEPTALDNFFVFSLTLSYLIGYAYFLGFATTRFFGGYTHMMVKSMMAGIFSSAILKMVIVFVFFNFMYIKVMTEENILWLMLQIKWIPGTEPYLFKWYKWLVEFRGVLPWSANFVVATTLIFCSIIAACYLWALRRNKKLRVAGSYT